MSIIIEDHGESMIDGDLMTIIERKLKYKTINKLVTK